MELMTSRKIAVLIGLSIVLMATLAPAGAPLVGQQAGPPMHVDDPAASPKSAAPAIESGPASAPATKGTVTQQGAAAGAAGTAWKPDYGPLLQQVSTYLGRLPGDWSLYFKDLNSGVTFGIDADMPVPAASTVKVPVVLYASHLVSQGTLRWTDKVAYVESADWRDGAGSMQSTARDGSKYAISYLCKKAIVESDNVAWKMLERSLGLANIGEFMRDELGGTLVYPGGENVSTARDMVTYMGAALQFSKEDPASGKDLMNSLAHTIWNDGLSHLLKGKVTIAHKEGAISGVANDVGVVYAKHPYIVAVMSKDQGNLDDSFEKIAQVSRMIYNHQASTGK